MKKITIIMLVMVCSIRIIAQTQCLKATVDGSNNVSFDLTADGGTFMLQAAQIYFTSSTPITVGSVTNPLGGLVTFNSQGGNSYFFSVVFLAPSATIGAAPTNLGKVSFTGAVGTLVKTSSDVFQGGVAVSQTASCDVVLPVELVTFKGIKKGKVSQLQWEATGEKNLVNYIVERSTDGRNFHAVGFTKPKSFNATEKVAYDFVDDQPEMGINYYRLLSKGFGKDEKYSKVISLDFGLGLSGRVYPNPLDGDLSIDLDIESNSGTVDVSIFDVVGKQILSKKIENSDRRINMTLPTADLAPGSYIVKVKVGTFNWERKITKM